MRYAFIRDHARKFPIRRMCKVLEVHHSGYYAWRKKPDSARTIENRRIIELIKRSWHGSGQVYGYRKVAHDLRAWGETCGKHRVARLMRLNHMRSQSGYRRRPSKKYGRPGVSAHNNLQLYFNVLYPNHSYVHDIKYFNTIVVIYSVVLYLLYF